MHEPAPPNGDEHAMPRKYRFNGTYSLGSTARAGATARASLVKGTMSLRASLFFNARPPTDYFLCFLDRLAIRLESEYV